jgi:dihydrofolate reductase
MHADARGENAPRQRPTTVAYVGTSLDGFIARPDGDVSWLPPPAEGQDYGWSEFIATIDALVMGRATFEKVLSFGGWPYEGTPVYALSQTLEGVPQRLEGKAEVSSLAPHPLMQRLAAVGHDRIYVDGGRIIQSFLRADLLDEIVVTTAPILIGKGIPLFGSIDADMPWEHLSTQTYDGGLVKSSYRRKR